MMMILNNFSREINYFTRKVSVGESFIGNFLSVGKSVGNKNILLPMDLLIEKASKKNISL
jgi:hypothetical protein